MDLVFVSTGAIGGALTRYGITVYGQKKGFLPWTTMAINVTGSLILGSLAAYQPPNKAMLMLGTGYCGAFTTYSTFSVV